jgi:hypothetical protein
MADKKKAKGKAPAKSKDKDKGKGKGDASDGLRVMSIPRAARSIHTAKAWGGLFGFFVVLFLSKRSGVPFYWSAIRAVLGGMAGYVAAWACAVTVWRELLVAQIEARRQEAISSGELVEQ